MKRYHRMLRFKLARLEEDELRGPLEEGNLRVEQLRIEAHDVLVDVSLDADSAEEADSRALAAVRFIPAWRVAVTRTDPPGRQARLDRAAAWGGSADPRLN